MKVLVILFALQNGGGTLLYLSYVNVCYNCYDITAGECRVAWGFQLWNENSSLSLCYLMEKNLNGSLILQMDFSVCIQDATCAIQNEEEVTSVTSNIDVTGSISWG